MDTPRTFVTAILFAFAFTSSASAGVTFEFLDRGNPRGLDGMSISGYHGYTLHLHSNSGNIRAVDFSRPFGFSGRFVQRWPSGLTDGYFDVPTPGFLTQQNLGNSNINFDTHFLGVATNLPIGSALIEDATIGPPGTRFDRFPVNTDIVGYGPGTYLRGAYGVIAAAQSPDLDVAYLVIADRDIVPLYGILFTAQVATAGGTFSVINPEPASVWLAWMSLLHLLRRRRQRASERASERERALRDAVVEQYCKYSISDESLRGGSLQLIPDLASSLV